MHFISPRPELTKAVDIVQHAIAKTQNSILDCILFDCRDDCVTLKATDKTLAISTTFPARISEDGVAAVPARLLGEILKKLPNEDVTFSSQGSSTAKIQCGASRLSLNLQDAAEFPSFPTVDASSSVVIPFAQLRRMIDQVIFAVAVTEDKPILTGVLFEIGNERLTLAAIDGFRMAVRETPVAGEISGSFVAPSAALREVGRVATDSDMDVQISFDRLRVHFQLGNTQILTQLLEGEYVPYRTLFPKSFSIHVETDRLSLLQSVERAIIMSDASENSVIRMEIQENALTVSSGSEKGRMEETIPAVTQGDDLRIAMNGRFLMDVLKVIEDDDITLLFNTSTSPCALERNGIESYGYLILPMQVS